MKQLLVTYVISLAGVACGVPTSACGQGAVISEGRERLRVLEESGLESFDVINPTVRSDDPKVEVRLHELAPGDTTRSLLEQQGLKYSVRNVGVLQELNLDRDLEKLTPGAPIVVPVITGPENLVETIRNGNKVELMLWMDAKHEFMDNYERFLRIGELGPQVDRSLRPFTNAIREGSHLMSEDFINAMTTDLKALSYVDEHRADIPEETWKAAITEVKESIDLRTAYLKETKNVKGFPRERELVTVKVDVLADDSSPVHQLRVQFLSSGHFILGRDRFKDDIQEFLKLSSGSKGRLRVGSYRIWAIDPKTGRQVTDNPKVLVRYDDGALQELSLHYTAASP